MKWGRSATIASGFAIAALGVSLGLSLSGAVGAAGAATTSAAAVTRADSAAAAPRYVVLNCEFKAQVKPGTFVLTCADYNSVLTNLHWTSWTPELASAYGTQSLNDCRPDCASGHFHNYPVAVVLWGSATVKGHPAERRYKEITLIYLKGRPLVYNGYKWVEGPVTETRDASASAPHPAP